MHPYIELDERYQTAVKKAIDLHQTENELRAAWPSTVVPTLGLHQELHRNLTELLGICTEIERIAIDHGDQEWMDEIGETTSIVVEEINDVVELMAIGEQYMDWAGIEPERSEPWDEHSIKYLDETGNAATVH